MFGDGFFGQWRLKLMSAFTAGMVASTSMLTAGNPEVIIKEIKKEIRNDGLSYSFEVTENFDIISIFSDLLKGLPEADQDELNEGIKLWRMAFEDFGFKDIDGYGSSLAKEGSYYDYDYFMHLKPGNEKSLFWKVLGGDSSELTTLKMIPESTILSLTLKLDATALWKYIKAKAPQIQFPNQPDLGQSLAKFEQLATQMGTPVEEVANALSTELSIFVTIDKSKKMMLPGAPPLPQLSATLLMKKKGDFLQNYIVNSLKGAPLTKSNLSGFSVNELNHPLPSGTKAGMAFDKDYLILSSDISSLSKIVEAKNGKGLLASSKFAKFKSVKTSGNGALYVSPEVSNTITEVTRNLPGEASMIVSIYSAMFFQDNIPELFLVYGKRSNGIKTDMMSSFRVASTQVQTVAVIGILAAMILPALGKARMKAKQAKSKSRLKQMGTTVAMYYTDGGSTVFPKDLKKFDFDPDILSHPGSDKITTLEDIMNGEGDYIMLFKPGKDNYTGGASKLLFMERPGIWPDGKVQVVFEDGHVSTFFGNTVEEVLKAIKNSGF